MLGAVAGRGSFVGTLPARWVRDTRQGSVTGSWEDLKLHHAWLKSKVQVMERGAKAGPSRWMQSRAAGFAP